MTSQQRKRRKIKIKEKKNGPRSKDWKDERLARGGQRLFNYITGICLWEQAGDTPPVII